MPRLCSSLLTGGEAQRRVSRLNRVRRTAMSLLLAAGVFAASAVGFADPSASRTGSKALQDAVPEVLGSGPQAPSAPVVRNKILLIPLDSRPPDSLRK